MKNVYYSKKIYNIEILASTKIEIDIIKKALLFIKTHAPQSFSRLKKLQAIIIYPNKDYNNILFPKENIYICQQGTIIESSMPYLASLLIHEAHHLLQYKKDQKHHGQKTEEEAYKAQRRFLKKYGTKAEVDWLDNLFKDEWWIKRDKKTKKIIYDKNDDILKNLLINYQKNKITKILI